MKRTIFREFSIRGDAQVDLPDEVVTQIGRGIGTYFLTTALESAHPLKVVLGRDVRLSSGRISRALTAGLLSTGVSVIDIGLLPTPVLNFAVDHFQAYGGIMITASHNPPGDNGFKLRTDVTLTGAALQEIYDLTAGGSFIQGMGKQETQDGLSPYLAALEQRAVSGSAKRIVIDGGNIIQEHKR